MANQTIKVEVAKNARDAENMSDSGINFEIKFSKNIIARMAEANWEQSFTLAYDPIQGVTLVSSGSQWIPFEENPPSLLPNAPLPGAQEPPVEPRTAPEPRRNLGISTQASHNEPIRRPAPAPLVPDHPHTRTALGANTPRALAVASESRTKATIDNDSSAEIKDDDEWKAKAVDILIQAAYGNQPQTGPGYPHAPTGPNPNTQGGNDRGQRASARSDRRSGGQGGQKKRGRDEDTAAGLSIGAKKTKM